MITDPYARLRGLFSEAGYAFVEPPIVHDAAVFVEVAGEDLRRRMFLTSNGDGRELALRPEYTVPVCLHHLANGSAARRGSYAYLGPVFRQRKVGPNEFLQAGVESIGRSDTIVADADVLALALAVAAELKLTDAPVRIGDSGVFAALLVALEVAEPWQRRLRRAFGEPARLRALIAANAAGTKLRASSVDRVALSNRVSEMFAATSLGVIGARTADEIAERSVEKEVLAAGIGARAAARLGDFLNIAGPPGTAMRALRSLARNARLDIGEAVDRFQKRIDAFADCGIDLNRLAFAADFGRRLDYYTGFVFELQRGNGPTIIGGGRYDRLLSLIHHPAAPKRDVPAIGFAVSLDRAAKP
jgi:ATP phosphoribosyltransferase regulatory subunit